MERITNLVSLLMHHIQNLYSAEGMMLQGLPTIIQKAKSGSLKKALEHHLKVTEEQKKRLEQIPPLIKKKIGEQAEEITVEDLHEDYECKGMKGMMEEAADVLALNIKETVTDAAIIAYLQKMEN